MNEGKILECAALPYKYRQPILGRTDVGLVVVVERIFGVVDFRAKPHFSFAPYYCSTSIREIIDFIAFLSKFRNNSVGHHRETTTDYCSK